MYTKPLLQNSLKSVFFYRITSRSASQSAFKREPNAMNDHARELKRQKPIDQGESKLFLTVLLSDFLHM
jgi:hypothetical protein